MLVHKPPMGWNSWNTFMDNISDKLVRDTADAFIELGLKDAGYNYVVIDDCWSLKTRDPITHRIIPDPEKFPNGIKALTDYVHSKGLKFGIYSCAGERTCADYPGSFDHEFLDAETFAEWGVDFLKYDFCYKPFGFDGQLLYRRMGMALRACGRDILFSACNWGSDNVWDWIRTTGAHMYRSTGDIHDVPGSYRKIAQGQLGKLATSAPQCFNDMDMLTVGMYGRGPEGLYADDPVDIRCSDADYRSQFALWCMFSAPLMLGCDVRSIDATTLKLVTNKNLLRINQDSEVRPPMMRHSWTDKLWVLVKHLDDGTYAIGFFNMTEQDNDIPATFSDFGLSDASGYDMEVEGVLEAEGKQTYRNYMRVNVPAHDCKVFIGRLVKR